MANLGKWVNLSFLLCGVVAWALLREIFPFALDGLSRSFGWGQLDWIIPPQDIGGFLIGAILFIVLIRSKKATEYLSAVLAELSKVTWPKRKETALSTGVVAVMIAIATLVVLLFDSIWRWIAETFIYMR